MSDPENGSNSKKKKIFLVIGIALLGLVATFTLKWFLSGRFIESTDDAYVKADIVSLVPEISGKIIELPVAENSIVTAGDVILKIDPTSYQAQLDTAHAKVNQAAAQVSNIDEQLLLQELQVQSMKADFENARSQLNLANTAYERARKLRKSGVGSQVKVDSAIERRDETEAAWTRAKNALSIAKGQFPILQTERNSAVASLEAAKAELRLAEKNFADTTLIAPIDGVVSNSGINIGDYVSPPIRVMSIVPTKQLYITANFKETQIKDFKPGLHVEIEADMLGGEALEGVIDSLAPATGAEFSILPPENATGNFTKIVQRIPVRIRLVNTEDMARLRVGTSVVAHVDVRLPQ